MNRRNLLGHDLAAPLNSLQAELNRLYDHYTHAGTAAGPDGSPPPAWSPPLDVYETDEEIGVLVDLPGIDPATVEVSVSGRALTIRGHQPVDEPPPRHERTPERPQGPFSREVQLPADVDVDSVRAEARDGVITIRLPKVATARGRTIPVRVG